MKAITIKQPWAWAIAAGHKMIENRTWRTNHRGLLAIHAGQAIDDLPRRNPFRTLNIKPPSQLILGAVVAVVVLDDVVELSSLFGRDLRNDPFASGPYCWRLTNRLELPRPIPCRGLQALWELPPEVAVQIAEQLPGLAAR